MQDSKYINQIEVSERSEQVNNTLSMMIQNNKTGFRFNPSSKLRYFRVYFKIPITIALVQILTPRSNVEQIRLSYFDEFNRTIQDDALQKWQINYISDFGRENNSIDKLCPNFLFRGIRVDILQPDAASSIVNNATLKVFIRTCVGPGGIIRKNLINNKENSFSTLISLALCAETNILKPLNVDKYEFTSDCKSVISQSYENQNGDNCALPNPEIAIQFKQPNFAYISQIDVQNDAANPKYQGNIQQIAATFIGANGLDILDEISGQPLRWVSPQNDPVIKGYFENIRGVKIQVLKTDNNEPVKRLRMRVTGCHSPRKKNFIAFLY
jgi:hypothetical protein